MAFCGNCGTNIEEGKTFCPNCGTSIEGAPAPAQAAPAAPANITPQDIEENKMISILCYFGILLLIPMLVKKDSPYVRFHSNQGLVLFLLSIAISIITVIPILGWIIGFAGGIFVAVLAIMGIINTVKGLAKPLPLIGGISILK